MRKFLVICILSLIVFPSLTNAKFYWYDIQEEQDGIVYYDFYNSTLIDNEITYYKLINFNETIGKESNIKSFPTLSYQHGTQLLDSSAPSIVGVSLSGIYNNFETTLIGLITASSGFISLVLYSNSNGSDPVINSYLKEVF